MRHSLSGEALADLLTLINLHCLSPDHTSKTLHSFRKDFSKLQKPFKISSLLLELPNTHSRQKTEKLFKYIL